MRDLKFPLTHKIVFRLPQHYVSRLDGFDGRLVLIEMHAWVSDFQIGKLNVKNRDESQDLARARQDRGDYSVVVSLTGDHRPGIARAHFYRWRALN